MSQPEYPQPLPGESHSASSGPVEPPTSSPLRFSYGKGHQSSHAEKTIAVYPPSANAFAQKMGSIPPGYETFWSPIVWDRNKRRHEDGRGGFESARCVATDSEWHGADGNKAPELDPLARLAIAEQIQDRQAPGSLLYWTNVGVRVIFLLNTIIRDVEFYRSIADGAGEIVRRWFAELGIDGNRDAMHTDRVSDPARMFFLPNSIVRGIHRRSDLHVMREELFDPRELAEHAPAKPMAKAFTGPRPIPSDGSELPGQAYNMEAPWGELLSRHGWTFSHATSNGVAHWTRPGKHGGGTSATTGWNREVIGVSLIKVFSSGAFPFEQDQVLAPFSAFQLLEFGAINPETASLAARQLRQLGYGSKAPRSRARRKYRIEFAEEVCWG